MSKYDLNGQFIEGLNDWADMAMKMINILLVGMLCIPLGLGFVALFRLMSVDPVTSTIFAFLLIGMISNITKFENNKTK